MAARCSHHFPVCLVSVSNPTPEHMPLALTVLNFLWSTHLWEGASPSSLDGTLTVQMGCSQHWSGHYGKSRIVEKLMTRSVFIYFVLLSCVLGKWGEAVHAYICVWNGLGILTLIHRRSFVTEGEIQCGSSQGEPIGSWSQEGG